MYVLNKNEFNIFSKKNIHRYIINKLCGLYRYKKLNPNKFVYVFELLCVLSNFKYLNRFYMPQVEFFITSRCTLKCLNCSNYIPEISQNHSYDLSFTQFKMYLDNLLFNVYKLNSLILVGGEPLLNKDFLNMFEYALKNPKVENVYFFTNGTINFSDELLSILKKYRRKACVYLSNYMSNKALNPILKTYKILSILKKNKIRYIFDEKQIWIKKEDISCYNRSKELNSETYIQCNVPSVSVALGKMHLCPKSIAALFLNKIEFTESDFLDLNKIVTKEALLKFYSQENFSICGYCSGPNSPKRLIKPAEQIESL